MQVSCGLSSTRHHWKKEKKMDLLLRNGPEHCLHCSALMLTFLPSSFLCPSFLSSHHSFSCNIFPSSISPSVPLHFCALVTWSDLFKKISTHLVVLALCLKKTHTLLHQALQRPHIYSLESLITHNGAITGDYFFSNVLLCSWAS